MSFGVCQVKCVSFIKFPYQQFPYTRKVSQKAFRKDRFTGRILRIQPVAGGEIPDSHRAALLYLFPYMGNCRGLFLKGKTRCAHSSGRQRWRKYGNRHGFDVRDAPWPAHPQAAVEDQKQITASPLRAGIGCLKRFPRTMILNGQADVLRSEGEAFGEKLRSAGVKVTALRVQGTIHDFVMLHALDQTNACRTAMDASTAWVSRP